MMNFKFFINTDNHGDHVTSNIKVEDKTCISTKDCFMLKMIYSAMGMEFADLKKLAADHRSLRWTM